MNDYIAGWESKPQEIEKLTQQGIVPLQQDMDDGKEDVDIPFLMGQVAAVIGEIKPAGDIVRDMVSEACEMMKLGQGYMASKL